MIKEYKENKYIKTLQDYLKEDKTNESLMLDNDEGHDDFNIQDDDDYIDDDFREKKSFEGGDKTTSIINKIRKLSLDGLSILSDNVGTPQYDVLKKIFMMIDKANEEKSNDNIEKQKQI